MTYPEQYRAHAVQSLLGLSDDDLAKDDPGLAELLRLEREDSARKEDGADA